MTQFTISCAVELLRLVTSDDRMTSLLKKLSISIKIHVVKLLCSVFKLSSESVGSRRELVANCVHTADADVTRRNSVASHTSASDGRRCISGLTKSSSCLQPVMCTWRFTLKKPTKLWKLVVFLRSGTEKNYLITSIIFCVPIVCNRPNYFSYINLN